MIGLYEAMRDKAAVTLSLSVPLTALLPRQSTTRTLAQHLAPDSVQYSARLKYGERSNRLSEVTNYTITPPRLSSLKCIRSHSPHKSEKLFLTASSFSLTNWWSIHLIMLWECPQRTAEVLRFSCGCPTPALGAVGPDGCPAVVRPALKGLYHQKRLAIRAEWWQRRNRAIFSTAAALGRYLFDGPTTKTTGHK